MEMRRRTEKKGSNLSVPSLLKPTSFKYTSTNISNTFCTWGRTSCKSIPASSKADKTSLAYLSLNIGHSPFSREERKWCSLQEKHTQVRLFEFPVSPPSRCNVSLLCWSVLWENHVIWIIWMVTIDTDQIRQHTGRGRRRVLRSADSCCPGIKGGHLRHKLS